MVARPHPKTADEACNLDWGPLECQCVASSGTVFDALWFCPGFWLFGINILFSHSGIPGQALSWCSSAGGTVLQVLRLHSGHCGHCEKEGAVAWEIARGYCPTLLIWPAVWGFLHQDVSPAVWGFFKLMMFRLQFWDAFLIQNFSPAVSGWRLLNSRCFTWAQACPWCVLGVCVSWMQQAMRFLRNSFKLCTWFTIHRLGADLDYNVIVEHVFVMTSWFSTPLPG